VSVLALGRGRDLGPEWCRDRLFDRHQARNRSGGEYFGVSTRLGQQQYRSPSVFNFYRPGYVASGTESAAAGLVAPELQITTTTSVTSYSNFMRSLIQEARQDRSFLPSYAAEIAIAEDANALVDRLNLVMTANTMTPETRTRIVNAVNSVSIRPDRVGEDRRNRVNLAMLMIVLSSEYTVQR